MTRTVCFQVEGLMDDIDFKAKVTRAEFEELCADLFERVPGPVQDAMAAAEMNMVGSPSPRTSCQLQLQNITTSLHRKTFNMISRK